MDLELNDKRVLITGGSKGIGLACAHAFAAEGAQLALCSRSQAHLDAALAHLPGAIAHAADLCDSVAALAMLDAVETQLGPIDILVNSAGAARRVPADELSPAAWRAAMDAKFFSYIHVIDPLIKRMAQRGTGVIVSILGSGGKVAAVEHIAGGAANSALMLATAGLGLAYAPRGVRVVGISPGLTDTDRVAEGMQARARIAGIDPEEARRRSVAALPLGRMATADEIASAVLFAASARASHLTATNISMDGGAHPTVL
jgi:NAD(P)-dependent dehydrogenase (short-subunit alcohol dehydrogenase family)